MERRQTASGTDRAEAEPAEARKETGETMKLYQRIYQRFLFWREQRRRSKNLDALYAELKKRAMARNGARWVANQ